MVNKLLLIFSLAVFFSCAAYSQGTIKGCIKNTKSVPMFAIVVYLISEDSLVDGAFTDYKGEYLIENISAGTYDIIAENQYGYFVSQRQNGIAIRNSETKVINFTLDCPQHDYPLEERLEFPIFPPSISIRRNDTVFCYSLDDDLDSLYLEYYSVKQRRGKYISTFKNEGHWIIRYKKKHKLSTSDVEMIDLLNLQIDEVVEPKSIFRYDQKGKLIKS